MTEVDSLRVLQKTIAASDNTWLLLYKKGSEQSDCAFLNFKEASKKADNGVLLFADVNKVRDIHPEYKITSVPTLIHFKNGELSNLTKGCHKPEHFNAIFVNTVFVSDTGEEKKPAKRVTVYSTPTCSWCTTIKRHLDTHGIRYREIDVSKDTKAAEEMVKKSGQQGVPQTDINGQMIVGFDQNRINNLLGIN